MTNRNQANDSFNTFLREQSTSDTKNGRKLTAAIFALFKAKASSRTELSDFFTQSGPFTDAEKRTEFIRDFADSRSTYAKAARSAYENAKASGDAKPSDRMTIPGESMSMTYRELQTLVNGIATHTRKVLKGLSACYEIEQKGGKVEKLRQDGQIQAITEKGQDSDPVNTQRLMRHAPKPASGSTNGAPTRQDGTKLSEKRIDILTAMDQTLTMHDAINLYSKAEQELLQDILTKLLAMNVAPVDGELNSSSASEARSQAA